MRRKRHTAREVRALSAVTKWAQDHGYDRNDLPRGRRDSCDECVLARATGYLVVSGYYAVPGEGSLNWRDLPGSVQLFLELFDRGKYPELEIR